MAAGPGSAAKNKWNCAYTMLESLGMHSRRGHIPNLHHDKTFLKILKASTYKVFKTKQRFFSAKKKLNGRVGPQ